MKIFKHDITFSEVPDHISLTIFVDGCKLNCDGCFWKGHEIKSIEFGLNDFKSLIDKYGSKITCVCFLGGEWSPFELMDMIDYANDCNLKTCLYTGHTMDEIKGDSLFKKILSRLDIIKVGRYIKSLGSLDESSTNQQLINLKTNTLIKGKKRA